MEFQVLKGILDKPDHQDHSETQDRKVHQDLMGLLELLEQWALKGLVDFLD